MKYINIFLLIIISVSYAHGANKDTDNVISNSMILKKMELYQDVTNKKFEIIFQELSRLRQDMDKRFEQVDKRFEQVDKRFEQVDKRFEQVDKRFEFIQQIIIALIVISTGTPITIEILRRKREKTINEYRMELEKQRQEIQKFDIVISLASKNDENMRNAVMYAINKGYSFDAIVTYA